MTLSRAEIRARAEEIASGLASSPPPTTELHNVVIDWTEFWSRDRTDPEWAVEGILARGRGHSIYARHKVGKSLLSLHLALRMVESGMAVLYLDFEQGEDDLYERISDMGCGPETDLSRLLYALLPSLPPLDSPAGGAALARLMDEAIAQTGAPLAVIIDTFSRVNAGGENDNDTVQAFYRYSGLEMKRRAVTWVRLDHAGWDDSGGARGASGKGDDVDVVWRLSKLDGGLELTRVAARMGWVPEKVPLRLVSEPVLAFETAVAPWPAGTLELAKVLDRLGVPLEASERSAQRALREEGEGRRTTVVRAALKYRRMTRDAPPDALGSEEPGRIPGRSPQNPHSNGPDALPDASGRTSVAPASRFPGPPGDPDRTGPSSEVLAEGDGWSAHLESGPPSLEEWRARMSLGKHER